MLEIAVGLFIVVLFVVIWAMAYDEMSKRVVMKHKPRLAFRVLTWLLTAAAGVLILYALWMLREFYQ